MLLQIEEFHSFLWLSNSPLCVCVCMCVCLYIYTHTYIYVYHILFIHLSVDGHLSYFFIGTSLHTCLCVYTHACVDVCMYVCEQER